MSFFGVNLKRSFVFGLVIAAQFVAGLASAEVRTIGKVNAATDLPAWNEAFAKRVQGMQGQGKYPATGYMECAETTEISGAILCLSRSRYEMNLAFNRISAFVEGLNALTRGEVVEHDNGELKYLHGMVGGHDLKEQDIVKFLRAAQIGCRNNKKYCLNRNEIEIFNKVILPSYYNNKKQLVKKEIVVITYALESSMSYQDVVTHEILHAQYFLQPAFQQVVDKFWAESVPEADKKRIRGILSATYDPTDELLMRNEFQAYILMAGAEHSQLAGLVSKYRTPLMKALAAQGIEPLQVQ